MKTSSQRLKVLFVSSEVTPFSKTGGLADVSAALPAALAELGCDVRIVTPRYAGVDPESYDDGQSADDLSVQYDLNGHPLEVRLHSTMNDAKVIVNFADAPALYGRAGIYCDPASGQDYIDNDVRFVILCRAALDLCKLTRWTPDIIHCNDWQSGALAYFAALLRGKGQFRAMRVVMTIHNIAYHGSFGTDSLPQLGDVDGYFYPGGPLEFNGRVNFLKTGILFADVVNTVSPTYAQEIQRTGEYGCGLEGVLRDRTDGIKGILNGIDTTAWNPQTDPAIAMAYDANSLEKKLANKRALCIRTGLSYDERIPLFGVISRIADQKGFDLLIPLLKWLFLLPARVILLGSGNPHQEHLLQTVAREYPDRLYVRIGYDESLAHLIEAGADLFLMPSRYEPCGLNQMMSMRYGTVPIVRTTGGLADTVIDADADPSLGTGFRFNAYQESAFKDAVNRAVIAYHDLPRWMQIQRRGMSQDFSWNHSASLYLDMYRQCLAQPCRIVSRRLPQSA